MQSRFLTTFGRQRLGLRGAVNNLPWLNVATRLAQPDAFNAGLNWIFSRTIHTARDDITSIKALFPNWYLLAGEKSLGGDATIRVALEYPLGTLPKRITFNGGDAGTIPNSENLPSDALTVSIPNGANFAIKSLYYNAAGIMWASSTFSTSYEMAEFGTGTPTDYTATTTNPSAAKNFAYAPVALVAQTAVKSVLMIGDSRLRGEKDDASSLLRGWGARIIGPTLPYINCTRNGEASYNSSASISARLDLANFASHVLSGFDINTLSTGRTATESLTGIKAFRDAFGLPFAQATVSPNETAPWQPTMEAERVALNAAITAHPAWIDRVVPVTDTTEDTGGVWVAGYSDDLLHCNPTGNAAVAAAISVDDIVG